MGAASRPVGFVTAPPSPVSKPAFTARHGANLRMSRWYDENWWWGVESYTKLIQSKKKRWPRRRRRRHRCRIGRRSRRRRRRRRLFLVQSSLPPKIGSAPLSSCSMMGGGDTLVAYLSMFACSVINHLAFKTTDHFKCDMTDDPVCIVTSKVRPVLRLDCSRDQKLLMSTVL